MTLSGTVVLLLLRIAWAHRDLKVAYHLHHHHHHLQHQHQGCCVLCVVLLLRSSTWAHRDHNATSWSARNAFLKSHSIVPDPRRLVHFHRLIISQTLVKSYNWSSEKDWRTSKASALDSNKASQDKIVVKEYWSPNQTIKSDRIEICGRYFLCFKVRTSGAAGGASHIVRLPPK